MIIVLFSLILSKQESKFLSLVVETRKLLQTVRTKVMIFISDPPAVAKDA